MRAPSRYEKLGFKVVLEKDWLDLTVNLVIQGKTSAESREILRSGISSSGKRSELTTKFAVQILRAWIDPEDDLALFRNQLLTKIKTIPREQWIILHWACLTAAYPFLLSFSSVFGRLISLQNETTKAQLLARLQDIYGAREAVERALYYALGSFVNWGLIIRTSESNILRAPEKITVADDRIGILLWKSILHATQGNRLSVGSLRKSPALYAFDMPEIYPAQRTEDTPDLCYQRNAGEDILTIHQSVR